MAGPRRTEVWVGEHVSLTSSSSLSASPLYSLPPCAPLFISATLCPRHLRRRRAAFPPPAPPSSLPSPLPPTACSSLSSLHIQLLSVRTVHLNLVCKITPPPFLSPLPPLLLLLTFCDFSLHRRCRRRVQVELFGSAGTVGICENAQRCSPQTSLAARRWSNHRHRARCYFTVRPAVSQYPPALVDALVDPQHTVPSVHLGPVGDTRSRWNALRVLP